MFTTIVVGTDGTERAGRAVIRAAGLAAAYDATLHVIHAYQGTRPEVEDAAQRVVADVTTLLEPVGATVRTHALQGDPADAILDFAYDSGADLIIVGNRGMDTRRGRIMGSIPKAIAHDARCAVMIIQTDQE